MTPVTRLCSSRCRCKCSSQSSLKLAIARPDRVEVVPELKTQEVVAAKHVQVAEVILAIEMREGRPQDQNILRMLDHFSKQDL